MVGSFKLPISSGGSEEWTRPSDWLAMPTGITSADQIFVGLHAVIEDNDNYVAFLFTTSAGQYQVDWGDGSTPTLHNSNTIAQYQYNFATVSSSTLTSRGYKQCIITVTPVSGNFLTCNFQQRFVTSPVQNQAYSTGFLDCILSMPNATSIILGGGTVGHRYIERFDVKTIGNVTNINAMFQGLSSLQSLPIFDTTNVTTMNNTFEFCASLNTIPLFNTQNVTSFISTFLGCGLRGVFPLLNTSNVTTMLNMFSSSGINNIPLLNTSNVTNMQSMFANSSIRTVPLFNTSSVTNMSSIFQTCRELSSIPALSTASITTTLGSDFGNFCINNNNLNRCQMIFARQVAFQQAQLSRDALVEIFTNLVNRTLTTPANINITGNWGASALSVGDRLIATAKNWTITG
jgi:surface protein